MKFQRVAAILSLVNILLLVFLLSQLPASAEQNVIPLIRARAIELVDDSGKKRAQLNIEENGEIVFRLRDRNGTIRTKLGADEAGSGLILMDNRTEPVVQIRANKTGGSITLRNLDGPQRDLSP